MREWQGPSSSFYDPPNLHEVCKCDSCCDEGEHTNVEQWARAGCWFCSEVLEKGIEDKAYCLEHHGWYCDRQHVTVC